MKEWFKRDKNELGIGCVQTARTDYRWNRLEQYLPLRTWEHRLFEQLRDTVPLVDAALCKIVRLVGGFTVKSQDKATQKFLQNFIRTVKVGGVEAGLCAFMDTYLDNLLLYGSAAGEMVLDAKGESIYALYNSPPENLEVGPGKSPVELRFYVKDGLNLHPVKHPSLILYSVVNPEPGELRGRSLLKGLPFLGDILMQIFDSTGKNFERMGNIRFAVTCNPGQAAPDRIAAKEIAQAVAKEWSQAMTSREVKDFVAVGDVDIKVIGADNQVLDAKVPVELILQQMVAKLGLPPFLLGLSWSTTERMSRQQADILTSELEAYRRILTPVIEKICRTQLALGGQAGDFWVEWETINLQDELEEAQAKLLFAQAQKESGSGENGKGGSYEGSAD